MILKILLIINVIVCLNACFIDTYDRITSTENKANSIFNSKIRWLFAFLGFIIVPLFKKRIIEYRVILFYENRLKQLDSLFEFWRLDTMFANYGNEFLKKKQKNIKKSQEF